MKNSNSVVKGVLWSAVDRFSVIGLQMLFEIILARLLLPFEYGIIGMVAVFFAIAQVFVDGGFMNALIQKQDRTEIDFSTVFYTSLLISIILYLILFISAPYIALFYKVSQLTKIVRVLGLNIIVNSFALIYRTKLSISLDFKIQAKLSVLSVLLSGVLGVYLAYKGFGVWALVYQSICLYGFNTLFLVLNLRWKPLFVFSKESFNKLFGFGSKLLIAGLIQNIYSNLYPIFIGKVFPTKDLGLYTKSNQFTLYPSSMITNMLQRVMYPYLSKYQENDKQLFEINKQYYTILAILFFPLFIGLSVLADPFVRILLSNRWIEAVPIMRMLSIAFLFFPFINVNMFIFQIKGMSSRFLWIEILTKITGVIILLVTLKYNVIVMCGGLILQSLFQLIITSYFSDLALRSKKFSQLLVLIPIIIASVLISFITFQIIQLISFPFLQLIVGIFVMLLLYFTFYYFFMKDTLMLLVRKIIKIN